MTKKSIEVVLTVSLLFIVPECAESYPGKPAKTQCDKGRGVITSNLSYPPDLELQLFDCSGKNGAFVIKIATTGVGHLQTAHILSSEFPQKTTTYQNHSPANDNADDLIFLKPSKGWTMLTESEAGRLWGIAHERPDFLTFDVQNEFDSEKNIFHLDFKFKGDGGVQSYRVRGIGISNPMWINVGSDLSRLNQ